MWAKNNILLNFPGAITHWLCKIWEFSCVIESYQKSYYSSGMLRIDLLYHFKLQIWIHITSYKVSEPLREFFYRIKEYRTPLSKFLNSMFKCSLATDNFNFKLNIVVKNKCLVYITFSLLPYRLLIYLFFTELVKLNMFSISRISTAFWL